MMKYSYFCIVFIKLFIYFVETLSIYRNTYIRSKLVLKLFMTKYRMYVENRPILQAVLYAAIIPLHQRKYQLPKYFKLYKRQQTPFYFISALSTERLDFKLLGLAVCQVPGAISENWGILWCQVMSMSLQFNFTCFYRV